MTDLRFMALTHPVSGAALRRHLLDLLAAHPAAASLDAAGLAAEASVLEAFVIGREPTCDDPPVPTCQLSQADDVAAEDEDQERPQAMAVEPPADAGPTETADDRMFNLLRAAASEGRPCPSAADLGAALGVSETVANGLVKRLAGAGRITSIKRGRQHRFVCVDGHWTAGLNGEPAPTDAVSRPVAAATEEDAAVERAPVPPPPSLPPIASSLNQRLFDRLRTCVEKGLVCPKNRDLEDDVGATESDVAKAMAALRQEGRIEVERRGATRRIAIGGRWTPWPLTAEPVVEIPAPPQSMGTPALTPAPGSSESVERVFQAIAEAAVEEAAFPAVDDLAAVANLTRVDVQRAVDSLKASGRLKLEWQIGRCRACVDGLWTDWSEPPRRREVA